MFWSSVGGRVREAGQRLGLADADAAVAVADPHALAREGHADDVPGDLSPGQGEGRVAVGPEGTIVLATTAFQPFDLGTGMLPSYGGFDAVVAANVLHLVPDLTGALAALRRVVKPGGRVIVGEQPNEGFGLAGFPGRWQMYYGGRSPVEFGLDPDKGVLGSDGSRGWVLNAQFLSQVFGSNWRAAVYY